jgi:hypothetical protein
VPCHPWCTHRTSLFVKKKLFQFSCGCEQFHLGRSFGFLVINVCNHREHYETPCINARNKGKAVPLQAKIDPEGSRKLSFPDFMTTQDGGKVVSLTHRPPLPPGNTPGTHFCWRLSQPQSHGGLFH